MIGDDRNEAPSAETEALLSAEERGRVLSAHRLRATLSAFVVIGLLLFSTMMFFVVTRIFDWLTPSMQRDLEWKAQRGALELAQTTQIGVVVSDKDAVRKAAQDYLNDPDIESLLVISADGDKILEHGPAEYEQTAFAGEPGKAHDLDSVYSAWAPSNIEGLEIGRVALGVSKARLEAGVEMRHDVLTSAALGGIAALLFALLFVHFYIGPILRVTTAAFERLERKTEEALAAARLKSQFLANMSHEIRTPMNGVVGVIDLLNRTALSVKQQRYVQTIESSSRSLLTIIDDVLDFSRLEAGKYVMRLDDFELRQMVQEVAELLAPKAHAKGIELIQRVDAAVPFSILGDVDRLKQVITNLVGNAIKFTERGHVLIHVTAEAAGDPQIQLRFAVRDTGIGVSTEDQKKLFGSFSQVDGSLTRRYGGTGLGLAISKRLVEAQGGAVGVESKVGEGSTFWFTITTQPGALKPEGRELVPRNARVLLVVQDEAQRDVIAELLSQWGMRVSGSNNAEHACSLILSADHDRYDAAIIEATHERDAAAERLYELCLGEALPLIQLTSAGQAAPASSELISQVFVPKPVRASELYNGLISLLDGTPLIEKNDAHDSGQFDQRGRRQETILVVDDNEINRLVAVDLLHELGYRSDTACDGQEALDKARTAAYSAILMDCQMPRMDGYEATRCIRELPAPACRVPIIALTAHALVGDRDRVLRAGMDDYTTKPVRVKALDRVLRSWVEQKRMPEAALAAKDNEPNELDSDAPVLDPTIPRRKHIVEMFLRICPDAIGQIQDAAARGDLDALTKSAHKLKGGCLSLGAMAMAEACKGVELAARDGQVDRDNLTRLPALMHSASEALRREMSSDSLSVPTGGIE